MRQRDRLMAERISHERELRLAERAAFDHERELRSVFDAHERELRLVAEAAVEKARDIQFDEYERRLNDLNNSHERALREAARVVSQDVFETYKDSTRRELGLALASAEQASETAVSGINGRLNVLERAQSRGGGAIDLARYLPTLITAGIALFVFLRG